MFDECGSKFSKQKRKKAKMSVRFKEPGMVMNAVAVSVNAAMKCRSATSGVAHCAWLTEGRVDSSSALAAKPYIEVLNVGSVTRS